jgi:hypothetical protein
MAFYRSGLQNPSRFESFCVGVPALAPCACRQRNQDLGSGKGVLHYQMVGNMWFSEKNTGRCNKEKKKIYRCIRLST